MPSAPAWHARGTWGPYPMGVLGTVLIVLFILYLLGYRL